MSASVKHANRALQPNWRWVRLGDVCDFIRGISFDKSEMCFAPREGHIPVLRAGNIGQRLDTDNDLVWIPKERATETQFLKVGDIAICMSSGSADVVGKTAQVVNYFRGSVGAFCGIVRVKEGTIADYINSWFSSHLFLNWRDAQARGANIQNLRFSQLNNLEIPLPPLPEQQRIAAILKEQMAAVDKARAAAEARLDAVKALPAAFLREVFGAEPVISASPVTPRKAPLTGWTWHRLTDIARLATGHTPSRYHPEYWKGDVPWIQLADIRVLDGHEAQDTAEHTNKLGLANSSAVLLPKDTVCMSRTASVGFFTVMGRPMCTSQDFVNWVCGDTLVPWFLLYLLIASREKIQELGSGAVHKTIYFPTVKNFSVCIPPLAEQRRFANVLREQITAAETARAAAEAELAAINALPAALLRRAFNGEL